MSVSTMVLFSHSNSTEAMSNDGDEVTNEALSISFSSIAVVMLQIVLMILIVGGNTLVILAVWRFTSLQTTTNQFVVSLAVTDLLVGLALPFHATVYLLPSLAEKQYLCLGRFSALLLPGCASVESLLLVSVDRFIAIIYPLRYPSMMTKKVARLMLLCNWIQATLQGTVPLYSNRWHSGVECALDILMSPTYIFVACVLNTGVVSSTMIAIYSKIFQVAIKQHRAMKRLMDMEGAGGGRKTKKKISIREVNTTKTLAIVVCAFIGCWGPFTLLMAFRSMGYTPWMYESLYSLFILMGLVNSGLNPIIYAWKNKPFRAAFNKILGRNSNQVDPFEGSTQAT